MITRIRSLDQTRDYAKSLACELSSQSNSILLLLNGDLGLGKTTLLKYLVEALGISETVKSPSFTGSCVYHHESGWDFYHYDVYQVLVDFGELLELSNMNIKNIIALEWASRLDLEKLQILIPRFHTIELNLKMDGEERIIHKNLLKSNYGLE